MYDQTPYDFRPDASPENHLYHKRKLLVWDQLHRPSNQSSSSSKRNAARALPSARSSSRGSTARSKDVFQEIKATEDDEPQNESNVSEKRPRDDDDDSDDGNEHEGQEPAAKRRTIYAAVDDEPNFKKL